jgi:hypothetical protein
MLENFSKEIDWSIDLGRISLEIRIRIGNRSQPVLQHFLRFRRFGDLAGAN